MEDPSAVQIGGVVTYVDPVGVEHNALVTQVWSPAEHPGLNLTYVSDNEDEKDQYGRQIKRDATSVSHESQIGQTPGRFWK